MVPEQYATKLVGSRFGGGVDYAAGSVAEFSGVGRGLHRELLNRFWREIYNRASDTDARVIHSICQHGGAARTASVHVQIESGNRLF